jgi:hypothetical protein
VPDFFRRSPKYSDADFSDLSAMLGGDLGNSMYKHELLDREKLDFSVESLSHIDDYLDALHADPPASVDDVLPVVLRCGAYVGEVIRRNSHDLHWVAFKEAAKYSAFVKGLEHSAATAGILWRDAENMCFPLAKICKFIENGREESVHSFARVLLEGNVKL